MNALRRLATSPYTRRTLNSTAVRQINAQPRRPLLSGQSSLFSRQDIQAQQQRLGISQIRQTHTGAISSLNQHLLADGVSLVIDPEKSQGTILVDKETGKRFINFHGGFGSNALGENYRGFSEQFIQDVGRAAINKRAHADFYDPGMIAAVQTISDLYMKPDFKRAFFIDGGSLAVENGLKTMIRNKVLKNLEAGNGEKGKTVIGLEHAFHGRGGYTMTLSRSDRSKHEFMPKLEWPSFNPPTTDKSEDVQRSLAELEAIVKQDPDEIAGVIVEPIQCEGGDRHLPLEFFEGLKKLADQYGFYRMYDEVQTGFFASGKPFTYQQIGAPVPDIVSGAKKASLGYVFVSDSILDVKGNAFEKSGKINSTWGGHSADYWVMAEKLKLIHQDGVQENIKKQGDALLKGLKKLEEKYPSFIQNARGSGVIIALDVPEEALRNRIIDKAFDHGLLLIGGGIPDTGPHVLGVRPPLTITAEEVDQGIEKLDLTLSEIALKDYLLSEILELK